MVLTVIGLDRPGLVDSVAAAVRAEGGNWLESRMCQLGGQFAGILRLEVAAEKRAGLQAALGELAVKGIQIVVHESGEEQKTDCFETAVVEIVGQDRPGIVSHISAAFAQFDVNVLDLSTQCSSAPMSGERLFEAKAKVCIPADCDVNALREELETIAADLMVDVDFGSVEA